MEPELLKKSWWVYVLRCCDGSLYCGITSDLERRFRQHNAGKAARYTKGRGPLEMLHSWEVPGRDVALREEHAFKALSRAKKIALLRRWNPAGPADRLKGCTRVASGKS
jgi:putative endonuclease